MSVPGDHSDFDAGFKPARATGKSKEREPGNREVLRRIRWLAGKIVCWTGAPETAAALAGLEFIPVHQRLAERLVGKPPGYFAVEWQFADPLFSLSPFAVDYQAGLNPEVISITHVTGPLLAGVSRPLNIAKRRGLEVANALPGTNLEQLRGRFELCTRLLQASPVLRAGSLPSSVLGERILSVGEAGSTVARAPGGWAKVGQMLGEWRADVVGQITDPAGAVRRLAGSPALRRALNSPEGAAAAREAAFFVSGPEFDRLMFTFGPLKAALERSQRVAPERIAFFIGILREAMKRFASNHPLSHSFWRSLTPAAAEEASGEIRNHLQQFFKMDGLSLSRKNKFLNHACHLLLGLDFSTGASGRSKAAEATNSGPPNFIDHLHGRLEAQCRPAAPDWRIVYVQLAARSAALVGTAEGFADPAAWLDFCLDCAPPGRDGAGGVRMATVALEGWCGVGGGRSDHLARLFYILRTHAGQVSRSLSLTIPEFSALGQRLFRWRWTMGRLGALDEAMCAALFEAGHLPADCIFDAHPQNFDAFTDWLAHRPHLEVPLGSRRAQQFFVMNDTRLRTALLDLEYRMVRQQEIPPEIAHETLLALTEFAADSQELVGQEFWLVEMVANEVVRLYRRHADQMDEEDRRRGFGGIGGRTYEIVPLVRVWHKAGYRNLRGMLLAALDHYRQNDELSLKRDHRLGEHFIFPVEEGQQFALDLSAGDPRLFIRLCSLWTEFEPSGFSGKYLQCRSFWRRHPATREFLGTLAQQPDFARRIIRLARRLGVALRLKSEANLDAGFSACEAAKPLAGFEPGLPLAENLREAIGRLAALRALTGARPALPSVIQRLLDDPDIVRREKRWLEQHLADGTVDAKAAVRFERISQLLTDPAAHRALIELKLNRLLPKQLKLARLDALERAVSAAIDRHWEAVLPGMKQAPAGPDWDNALEMYTELEENRPALLKLLRCEARGDRSWIQHHPANRAFVEKMERLGLNARAWTGPFEMRIGTPTGLMRVYAETEPLRVLQMGNLFDTCLSAGGMNSFMAVACAVEVNKRVLYVANERGQIIGRKQILLSLIAGGANRGGILTGFNSYGQNEPLTKTLFDAACLALGRQVGARLETRGKLQRHLANHMGLFLKQYNDGPEEFDFWVTDASLEGAALDGLRLNVLTRAVTAKLKDSDTDMWQRRQCLRALLWLGLNGINVRELCVSISLNEQEEKLLKNCQSSHPVRRGHNLQITDRRSVKGVRKDRVTR